MLETITEAASSFCKEQLGAKRLEVEKATTPPKGTLVAYIDIQMHGSKAYRAYIAAQKEFVQFVAKIFLEEEESDEETIMDMALECTNLIIGSAKVVASQKGIDFDISTPKLQVMERFTPHYEDAAVLRCENNELFIAVDTSFKEEQQA